jgi:hypothetical protein
MLQLFYLYVAKVDLDVVYTSMLQAYVSSIFQVFHMYLYKCFISMLNMFAMVFKCFSDVFLQVFQTLCFKCFICFLLYVVTLTSGYFKSRSSVAHGMHVESGRRHGRRSG